MAGRTVRTAIARSGAPRCRLGRQEDIPGSRAPAATDSLAPAQCAPQPATRQRDAGIAFGGETSSLPSKWETRPACKMKAGARRFAKAGLTRPLDPEGSLTPQRVSTVLRTDNFESLKP